MASERFGVLPSVADRAYAGPLDQQAEQEWDEPFMFCQLCDTQYGMFNGNASGENNWREEAAMAELAVAHINRLKPKFAIVCGDLVHAQPSGTGGRGPGGAGRNGYDPAAQAAQVESFKETMAGIDPSIALLCLCGNHDLGNLPNKATVDLFTSRFGSDYFAFWAGGCRCLVLNSSLHATNLWDQIAEQAAANDGSPTDVLGSDGVPYTAESVAVDVAEAAAMAEEQEAWLDRELAALAESQPAHSLVFTHIPPFCDDEQEPDAYHCYPLATRTRTLAKVKDAGVSKWFSGHCKRLTPAPGPAAAAA